MLMKVLGGGGGGPAESWAGGAGLGGAKQSETQISMRASELSLLRTLGQPWFSQGPLGRAAHQGKINPGHLALKDQCHPGGQQPTELIGGLGHLEKASPGGRAWPASILWMKKRRPA